MTDEDYMLLAYQEMLKSEKETQTKVGCILVKDNIIIGKGYKTRENHAERMAIDDAIENKKNIKNAVLFTTLEPCIRLKNNQEKDSCCELIKKNKIKKVFIGSYDQNPNIYREGWKFLNDNNICVEEFSEKITKEIRNANKTFENYFYEGLGNTGTGKVNHNDNGVFSIKTKNKLNEDVEFNIKWTVAGKDSAYIYGLDNSETAHAKYANEFKSVKNSEMYIYSHSVNIPLNEVGIFNYTETMILVIPIEIQSGPNYGDKSYFVKFKYKVQWK